MISVDFLSAFIGGVLTFLAPCTLPLIPAYIGFLGGAFNEGDKTWDPHKLKNRIMVNAFFFVFGFSIIFILVGMISGTIGQFYVRYSAFFSAAGGVLIVLFGLAMLGQLPLPRFFRNIFRGRKLPESLSPRHPFSAFALGILFALGLGPTCLGPILGYIMVLAVSSGTIFYGGFLLLVYSLGIAIPFLLVAYFYGSAFTYVNKLARYLPVISKVGGVLLIIIGIMLIIGQFGMFNIWATALVGPEWYNTVIERM